MGLWRSQQEGCQEEGCHVSLVFGLELQQLEVNLESEGKDEVREGEEKLKLANFILILKG